MINRIIKFMIRRLVTLYYKRTGFWAWSWGIDEETDINILSEVSTMDMHRYGTKTDYYAILNKDDEGHCLEKVEVEE